MDSPLTKMLEGVLGTCMMNHPIVSAHYAGKVITDVNPGSQTCQEIEDSLPACTD